MKKRILILTVVMVLLVSSFALVACENKDFDIYPKWVYENVWEQEAEQIKMAEGGNLRIMSYNVLVEAWNKRIKTRNNSFDGRVEQVAKTIDKYSPEVVALQEADGNWHSKLPKRLEGYEFVKVVKGGSSYTTMMYNVKKVSLVDQGKVKYTNRSESKMRYAVWALFEKNDTKDRFIVMNTHFDFGHDRKEMHASQMKEYGDLANELVAKFDAPAFLAGDYNCYEVGITDKKNPLYEGYQAPDLYKKFATDYDMLVDSNYIEGIEIFDGEHRKFNEPKWDHIFVTKSKASVLKYAILSNDFYTSASDHFPVFIDVKIGK